MGAPSYNNFQNLITFSRGTNATLFDSTGKLTYGPNNLALQSNTFSSATWAKINGGTGTLPVVTSGQTDPNGGTTAWRLQANSGGGLTGADYSVMRQTFASSTAGIRSIWIRSNTGVNQTVYFGTPSISVVTATPTWTRVFIKPSAASLFFDIGSYPGVAGSGTTSVDVLIWQAQCEEVTYQTTPSEYIPTTASAVYRPRLDYDPVTLALRGMLVEEQRTNLILQSQAFNVSPTWTIGASGTVNADTSETLSPAGDNTADKLSASSSNYGGLFRQSTPSYSASTTYTGTVYAKAGSHSFLGIRISTAGSNADIYPYFNLSTGVATSVTPSAGTINSVSMTPVGNGWYRCVVVYTTASTPPGAIFDVALVASNGNSFTVLGASANLYVWGAQLEVGAFPTSYIPTAASSVTRNADVATMSGSQFTPWYNGTQGTLAVNFRVGIDGDTSRYRIVAAITDVSTNNFIRIRTNNPTSANTIVNGVVASSGVTAADTLTPSFTNTDVRSALSFATGLSNFNLSVNSLALQTAASGSGLMPVAPDRLIVEGGSFRCGAAWIRSITYYPRRLSNTQLQRLTA